MKLLKILFIGSLIFIKFNVYGMEEKTLENQSALTKIRSIIDNSKIVEETTGGFFSGSKITEYFFKIPKKQIESLRNIITEEDEWKGTMKISLPSIHEQEIKQLIEKMKILEQGKNKLSEQVKNQEGRIIELNLKIKELESQNFLLQTDLAQSKQDLFVFNNKILEQNNLKEQIETQGNELVDLQKKLNKKEEIIQKLKIEKTTLLKTLQEANEKIETLTSKHNSFEDFKASVEFKQLDNKPPEKHEDITINPGFFEYDFNNSLKMDKNKNKIKNFELLTDIVEQKIKEAIGNEKDLSTISILLFKDFKKKFNALEE